MTRKSPRQRVFVVGDAQLTNHVPTWQGNGAVQAVTDMLLAGAALQLMVLPRGLKKKQQYTIVAIHAA